MPQHLILYREYRDSLKPFRIHTKKDYFRLHRGSRLTTLDSRRQDGGFEINVFSLDRAGFDAALAKCEEHKPTQAHILKLEDSDKASDKVQLEQWVKDQLRLQRTKRII